MAPQGASGKALSFLLAFSGPCSSKGLFWALSLPGLLWVLSFPGLWALGFPESGPFRISRSQGLSCAVGIEAWEQQDVT